MPAVNIIVPNGKVLIVGAIYDKIEKFSIIENIRSQYEFVIFNGGLCFPSDNIAKIANRINKIQELMNNKTIYLSGRFDLSLLLNIDNTEISNWILRNSNVAIIKFPKYNAIVTDGGIPPNINDIKKLYNNIETSFISNIDNKSWHESYNGGLGYVISNNPLTNDFPKYYNYSMQLGNNYGLESNVYAQEIDEVGLKKTILL